MEFEFYLLNVNFKIIVLKLCIEILFEFVYSLRLEVYYIYVIGLGVELRNFCGFFYFMIMVYCYISGVV